jgi:hypothetical protein
MSEQENMVKEWNLALMAVINGLVLSIEALDSIEGSGAVVKLSYEIMKLIMNNYKTEARKKLSLKLELLLKLASENSGFSELN